MWSCDQSFVTLAIIMREVIIISILERFDQKKHFFPRIVWLMVNDLGLTLGMGLKFYTDVAEVLKLKVRKFWGLILTFVEVPEEKLISEIISHSINQ